MIEFTGERYVPSVPGEIRQEHLHRYAWCLDFVRGREVLDIASGEGYGSSMLAASAKSVIGVDISSEAVAHAASQYAAVPNLRFLQGSADRLPLPDASLDVVVSFETIEHLEAQDEMLAEIRRVLRPQGFLVISSPNKKVYSDQAGYHNEFHVKELYFRELHALLERHFPAVRFVGHRMSIASAIVPLAPDAAAERFQAFTDTRAGIEPRTVAIPDPVYYIAVAAADAAYLPTLAPSMLHSESEDLYERYRSIARWGQSLDAEVARVGQLLRNEQARVEELGTWGQGLANENDALRAELKDRPVLRDPEVDQLRKLLIAERQRVNELSAQAQAHALTGQNEERRVELKRALREVDAYRAELARLRCDLDALQRSRSWRLTKPLRGIGRALRGEWVAVLDGLRRSPLARISVLRPLKPLGGQLLKRLSGPDPGSVSAAVARAVQDSRPLEVGALNFPGSSQPVVSVIIPAYGNLGYTLGCLQSIAANMPAVPLEVIVAEDASGDSQMEVLRGVPGLRYLEHAENLGFLRSCNRAAGQAKGEYLFFLNNDTRVTPGWIDKLLEVFSRMSDAGMVGSRLVYPDGRLQEAGGIVWSDASAWNFGRLQAPDKPEFGYVKESDYISGAAIMLRRDLFQHLGGFDELFAPAYCEDTDLAFRIRQHGLKVYYQPESVIVHFEGISHGTDTSKGIKAYQVQNQRKFVERWGGVLKQQHFANGEAAFLAKDRSQLKKTVLVIDHYIPQPDRDAGSRTMWQFIRLFQKSGMSVKFWPDNLRYDPEYTPLLQQHGVEVFHGPEYVGRFGEWIAANGRWIDYVLLSRPHISVGYLDLLREHCGARLLYYGHDVHHLRLREQIKVDESPHLLRDQATVQDQEYQIWRQVDTIYYPSETETDYVRSWLKREQVSAKVLTIPVYAFDSFPVEPWRNASARRDLVFVAGFAHAPNVNAAIWFVTKVMPLLRARHPGIRVSLVGSNPTEAVRDLACDDIVVTGFVSDEALAEYYARSKAAVAPLLYGGGMKGKVVEAMRFAVPCVTTPAGAQGFRGTESFLAVEETPEAFADAVSRLLDDPSAWEAASKRSQAFAMQHFSEDALWKVVREDIDPRPYPSVQARLDAVTELSTS